MFLKFSYPKPIITAAKVPPKTINIGGRRNRALTAPPSQIKAPKTEIIPKINPLIVPNFLIIDNPEAIWEVLLLQVFEIAVKDNRGSVIQLLLLQHLLR